MSASTSKAVSVSAVAILRAAGRAVRPHQWLKNLLCVVPLLFTGHVSELPRVLGSGLACLAFCFAASAVYLFNDLRDREQDQTHPVKRHRPIASGQLPTKVASLMLPGCLAISFGLAAMCNMAFVAVIGVYLLQNVAYASGLKKVVILDVMLVANGFLLRAAGGAFAINVTAEPWMVLCTLSLALLVAFGKRRHEIGLLEDAGSHRETLQEYSTEFLDQAMAIAAAAAMVMYSLFTVSAYATTTYGSQAMVLSVPMVLYAVFRFVFLVKQKHKGGEPTKLFIMDRPLLIAGILWIVVCLYAIYGPSDWLPWWRFGYFEDAVQPGS